MHIKRTLTFIEDIAEEAGQRVDPPLRKVAVAAIIENPFAGRFERDLKPLTDASAEIGRTICTLAVSMLAPYKAQSYGKAAIIGIAGEQEHGVSMLTTVFGIWLLISWHWPLSELWLQIKLVFIAALIAYHVYCKVLVNRFRDNTNTYSGVFYRWFNEFPALVLDHTVAGSQR